MLTIQVDGLYGVTRRLDDLARRQVPFAAARTITELARRVRSRTYDQMGREFDRPTPYTLRSMFVRAAQKTEPEARVGLRSDAPGKGTPWIRALGHHFAGGERHWKRFEGALQRAGVMPAGTAAVPPRAASWAMQTDQYGNLPRGTLVKLLAYFEAFAESGFRANMNAARRSRLAKVKRSKEGFKVIGGVAYFASWGRGGRSDRFAHSRFGQPLAAGIWAKRGIHGAQVAPVLLFVRRPAYRRRIDLGAIGRDVVAKDARVLFASYLAGAMRTAR